MSIRGRAALMVALTASAVFWVPLATAQPPHPAAAGYQSPYSAQFTHPLRELIGDLESGARGNPQEEAAVPHREWYSSQIVRKYGAWGPPARHYPPVPGAADKPL